ncbi:chitin synthase chs-2-like isoform X2 [Haliotis asinina]|uniref:chitin synthase chs-2-like isoform X2 n=1 Tax=Haliotis asinina TaxID=109174 RepID=UPI00353264D6
MDKKGFEDERYSHAPTMGTMQVEHGATKRMQGDPGDDDKDDVFSRPLGDTSSSYQNQHGSSVGSVASETSAPDAATDVNIDLTVNKKWKVDERLQEKMLASNRPTILVPIAKWICTILLGLGVLMCVGASKWSVIGLAANMNVTRNAILPERVEYSRSFIMISLMVLVPYCINFLRAAFVATCRKDMLWPNRTSVITGVIVAVLESFGVCLFALKILINFNGFVVILLMNAVFVLPFIVTTVFNIKQRKERNGGILLMWTSLVASMLQVAGLGLVMSIVFQHTTSEIWHVPVALVCLTVAWVPQLQELTVKPKQESEVEDTVIDYGSHWATASAAYNTCERNSQSNSTPASQSTIEDQNGEGASDPKTNVPNVLSTKWKMAVISNFVKVVGVVLFSYVLFYVDCSSKVKCGNFANFTHSWNLEVDTSNFRYFLVNLFTTLGGYALSIFACQIASQKWAFALPICFAGPILLVLMLVKDWCVDVFAYSPAVCMDAEERLWAVVSSVVCFFLAHLLGATVPIFRSKTSALQSESSIFWLPSYNGFLLEQWLILNKQTESRDQHGPASRPTDTRSRVYICTTMYRENEVEMRQLLQSVNKINLARTDNEKFFESHVIFDGGIRNKNISEFALQLLTLLKETLGILTDNCTKVETPYGMKLSWNLPQSSSNVRPMTFNIHLKDGLKVRNKKRWSQIMYMSYVIDFLMTSNDEDCYILTTDADVKFTPESVEALLDLMTRDRSVGAVCARTHPMGSGPLVWYQVFEYAIGHWFQKAAEHVLGSVLCAPGCFSVYRCVALKEILTVYSTNVEHAFDFLIKDMGEDRWLCTLMVQSGWRIEYCAASENSTHCPSEFEEFYKQRRRWIASTIANLMLLIKQWQIIRLFNYRVSLLFVAYQGALLFSTLIGPSTIILIVSGGLVYGWGVNSVASIIIQLLICLAFSLTCLYASDKTQMLIAKLLTFLYAVVMTAVVVGTAQQIVDDLERPTGTEDTNGSTTINPLRPSDVSIDFPVSVSTIYFAAMAGIYILAGLLHPRELYCLINSLWYLLCLPSGYLVLMIYSVCNITDRSWGTREEKTAETSVKSEPWHIQLRQLLENIFFCCAPQDKSDESTPNAPLTYRRMSSEDLRISSAYLDSSAFEDGGESTVEYRHPEDEDDDLDHYVPVPVDEWLPPELRAYGPIFKKHGFDNTLFISGMTEKELKNIGIKGQGTLQNLLHMIELLPDFEIEYNVPGSVKEWLETIGLLEYERNFKKNQIKRPTDLSVLKGFQRKEIEKELKITKAGHIKRLLYAIRKLREPTEAEKAAIVMKARVDRSPKHLLKRSNVGEYDFWVRLIEDSLKPGNKAFGIEGELKARLSDLRNSWLMILAVSNSLWLILITTLASKGNLTILGANPLGLSFLFIFGTLLVIQFLAMIIHRISTLAHFLARAPFKYGASVKTSWSFGSGRYKHDPDTHDDWEAIQTLQRDEHRIREAKRRQKMKKARVMASISESTSLLHSGGQNQVL